MKHFFLFYISMIQLSVAAQIIPVQHISFEDSKIEDESITSVYEDKDGFLWMALYHKGLVRFDGQNIECIYENPAVYSGNNYGYNIDDIYQDKYGYLWVIGGDEEANRGLVVSNRPVSKDLISDSLYFVNEHFGIRLLENGRETFDFSTNDEGSFLGHNSRVLTHYSYSSATKFIADTLIAIKEDSVQNKILSVTYLSDGSVAYTTLPNLYIVISVEEGKVIKSDTFQIDGIANEVFFETDNLGGAWAGGIQDCIYIPPINELKNKGIIRIPVSGPIKDAMLLDEQTLLVCSQGSGLTEVDAKTGAVIKNYSNAHGLKSNNLFSIHKGKNNLWIAGIDVVERLPMDYRMFNAYNSEFDVDGQPFIPADGVNATTTKIKLKSDPRTFTAACTGAGVVLFNKNGDHQLLDESSGLNSSAVLGIYGDDKGRLWVTTVKFGINCIYPKGVKVMPHLKNRKPLDLFGNDYEVAQFHSFRYSIIEGIAMKDKLNSASNEQAVLMSSSFGLAIFADNEKALFIPTDHKTFNFLSIKSGLKGVSGLSYIEQDKNGHLYVGNGLGLWRTKESFTKDVYQRLQKSGAQKASSVFTNEEIIEQIPLVWNDSVLTNVQCLIIHEDEIWVSVAEGILVLSSHDAEAIAFIPTPLGSPIPSSFVVRDNSIWGGTKNGLVQYDIPSHKIIKNVSSEDGLLNHVAWGPKVLSVDSEGLIYYGTAGGLMEYNPMDDKPDTSAISVVVRDYAYVENNWGKNELNLNYIGLTYDNPKRMNYKTMLMGHDDEWSKMTHDTEIRYTNLKAFIFPKTYEFKVQAADHRGQWHSTASTFPITAKPAIWARWWSFLLYAALIYLAIRKYTRWQLAEQKKTLALNEAKVLKAKNQVIEKKNAENELLLKEIHHRVKNNLQTISSLLSLQSRFIKDETALGAVQESKNRVESMALIHQKLYQGENLAAIEMKDYFENIGKSVKNSFGQLAKDINLDIDMNSIELDVDTAVPIGLITNELITNSFKHGFKDRTDGVIKISLSKNIDQVFELIISDNGVGIIADGNDKPKGFGSVLVQMLAAQLEGSLEESTDHGRKVVLRFTQQLSAG